MPRPDRSNALDHIVVIMFENRSFDRLLGRADAIALIDEMFGHMSPGLHAS
jgi:phospholipase C